MVVNILYRDIRSTFQGRYECTSRRLAGLFRTRTPTRTRLSLLADHGIELAPPTDSAEDPNESLLRRMTRRSGHLRPGLVRICQFHDAVQPSRLRPVVGAAKHRGFPNVKCGTLDFVDSVISRPPHGAVAVVTAITAGAPSCAALRAVDGRISIDAIAAPGRGLFHCME